MIIVFDDLPRLYGIEIVADRHEHRATRPAIFKTRSTTLFHKFATTTQNKYTRHPPCAVVLARRILAGIRGLNERSAPPHPWNEPQTSKRRFQVLASSRHINLNDLLASSFFKRRRRADFFLPVPEIAVSPAQRLLMLAFSCLFFPPRPPSLAV